MPANNTSQLVHYLAGRFPGWLGSLFTPARADNPRAWLPYGLDNGLYGLTTNGKPFDEAIWQKALDRYCPHLQPPMWLVVPDILYDADATILRYQKEAPSLALRHIPLAIAVQDGMTPAMVRKLVPAPGVIFVGGSTEWKWASVRMFTDEFPRVHVGRVNGRKGLDTCLDAGVESVDGTGWFRGRIQQLIELVWFLADVNCVSRSDLEFAVRTTRLAADQQLCLRLEQET